MDREHERRRVDILRTRGKTAREIAETVGVPLSTVKRWLSPEAADRDRAAKRAKYRRRGRDDRRQRLARRMYGELVRRFGVSERTFRSWVRPRKIPLDTPPPPC